VKKRHSCERRVAGSLRPVVVTIGVLSAGSLQTGLAQTQNASPASVTRADALQEVVVTATRREERLHDVPESIAVLSGADLAIQGITSVDQYSSAVPGLSFNRAGFGDRAGLDLTVRGISNTRLADTTAGTGALTTGFYIDDVAVQPVDVYLYDLDRMEVLKGPQGTLFGQASMGGTVRLITTKPDLRAFRSSVELSGSLTRNGAPSSSEKAMLNLPIIEDQLAARLVVYNDQQGGWIKWDPASLNPGAVKGPNPALPPGFPDQVTNKRMIEDVNDQKIRGGRLTLRYTPTAQLTITPIYIYQKKDQAFSDFIDRNLNEGYVTQNFSAEPRTEEFSELALAVDYDFPFARLTSVTARFDRDYRWTQDTTQFISDIFGQTPSAGIPGIAFLDFDFRTKIVSQELRLTSKSNRWFDWVVGAAYFDEHRPDDVLWLAPNHNSLTAPANQIPGGDQGLVYANAIREKSTDSSVFADLTLKLFDERLQLSAGARHFKDEFSGTNISTGALIGAVGNSVTGEPEQGSESGTTPRFSIKYAFTPDVMAYAATAKGFRAGGPGASTVQTPECADALAKAGVTPGQPFHSDGIISYELGTKTAWMSRSLSINADVFYIDWSNLQTNVLLNFYNVGCANVATANAGKAFSKGAEFSLAFSPIERLSLTAAATYTDAKLGRQPAGSTIGQEGQPLQNAPEWQGTLAVQFDFSLLHDNYRSFLRGDISYYGWQWTNQTEESNPFFYAPARALVNFRYAFRPPDGAWSAELFINNALNREQQFGAQAFFGEPRTNQALVGQPRTVGLLLRHQF
jgi:iron complex outermembrane receptor protein